MTLTPLLYVLHSGNLYGTERMALATADGLREQFEPTIFAPPGAALDEAKRLGLRAVAFASVLDLGRRLRSYVAAHPRLACLTTGVIQSALFSGCNLLYRRPAVHLHLVHGGAEEKASYANKRHLSRLGVRCIAVSSYVKERLIAHGVPADRVLVIENFLLDRTIASAPKRPPFLAPGLHTVVVVSRLDPIKRVDLLLDALDRHPSLAGLRIRVFGRGWDLDRLRARAQARNPNVEFAGFHDDVPAALAEADLLVHCCPVEPFGLAILEAMAAGVPVLVPNTGGAGSLVEDGMTGFHFHAGDADDLAYKLMRLRHTSPAHLNRITQAARRSLSVRFAASARLADYRTVLEGR
jgi:glycosyltransferase involved in cell wall biosynthesis